MSSGGKSEQYMAQVELAAPVTGAPSAVQCMFPEDVVRAVRKVFPAECAAGFDWPVLQDLFVQDVFTQFPEFVAEASLR